MAKKDKRFEVMKTENMGGTKIIVDTKTGVNYLYFSSGYSGGLTPLLDRDGTPITSAVVSKDFL